MSDNIFAQLQMASMNAGNSVIDARKDMNKIVDFFESRPDYEELLSVCAEDLRNLDLQTYKDAHAFMVQDDFDINELPRELRHDSLGFCTGYGCVYSGRLVYPVFDVKGDVMGWCGWDKFEAPKYLDSINYGYKAKLTTLYGMEKLEEYYNSPEPVFIPEGIVCTLYARQCGFHSLCALGSHVTPYVAEIIKRLGHRAVIIADSDEAGTKWRKQLHYIDKSIRVYQSTVAKDLDDSRKVNPRIREELALFRNPLYTGNLFV